MAAGMPGGFTGIRKAAPSVSDPAPEISPAKCSKKPACGVSTGGFLVAAAKTQWPEGLVSTRSFSVVRSAWSSVTNTTPRGIAVIQMALPTIR